MKNKKLEFLRPERQIELIDINVAKSVLKLVSLGLSSGIGDPKPGQMCIEAAVCYALGEPHGDEPTCVIDDVRDDKITLNDSGGWKNKKSRGEGLKRIAVGQLGSNILCEDDMIKYHKTMIFSLIRNEVISFIIKKWIEDTNKSIKRKDYCANDQDHKKESIKGLQKYLNLKGFASYEKDLEKISEITFRDIDFNITSSIDEITSSISHNFPETILIKIADAIEDGLRAAKSPGIKFLDELLPKKKIKKK